MKYFIMIYFIHCFRLFNSPCMVNEFSNHIGPHRCEQDEQCQGDRQCNIMGFCFGDSNCLPERALGELYKKSSCHIQEIINEDKSVCQNFWECKGSRKCENGQCMGESQCSDYQIRQLSTVYQKASCHIDEKYNEKGVAQCDLDIECKGDRTCESGFCEGIDKCSKYIIHKNRKLSKNQSNKIKRKLGNVFAPLWQDYIYNNQAMDRDMVDTYAAFIQKWDHQYFSMNANENTHFYCQIQYCSQPRQIYKDLKLEIENALNLLKKKEEDNNLRYNMNLQDIQSADKHLMKKVPGEDDNHAEKFQEKLIKAELKKMERGLSQKKLQGRLLESISNRRNRKLKKPYVEPLRNKKGCLQEYDRYGRKIKRSFNGAIRTYNKDMEIYDKDEWGFIMEYDKHGGIISRNEQGFYQYYDKKGKQIPRNKTGNVEVQEYTINGLKWKKDSNGYLIRYNANGAEIENSKRGIPLTDEYNPIIDVSKQPTGPWGPQQAEVEQTTGTMTKFEKNPNNMVIFYNRDGYKVTFDPNNKNKEGFVEYNSQGKILTKGPDGKVLTFNMLGKVWSPQDESTATKDKYGQSVQYDEYGNALEKTNNNQLKTYNNLKEPIYRTKSGQIFMNEYDQYGNYLPRNDQGIIRLYDHIGIEYRVDSKGKPLGSNQPKDYNNNFVIYNKDGLQLKADKNGLPITFTFKKDKIIKDNTGKRKIDFYDENGELIKGTQIPAKVYTKSGTIIQKIGTEYKMYKDAEGNPIYFNAQQQPITYDTEGKEVKKDSKGQPIVLTYDPEGFKLDGKAFDSFKNVKTYNELKEPYKKDKLGNVLIDDYDSKGVKIKLNQWKRPETYDYQAQKYETDKQGYVVEYNKAGQPYEKDKFGNIQTYDSNKKKIERTKEGNFIEYNNWRAQVIRNGRCAIILTKGAPKKTYDKNGNVKEYGISGELLEKDKYGNIVEYTKSGMQIPKDEFGKKIKLHIDQQLAKSEQIMRSQQNINHDCVDVCKKTVINFARRIEKFRKAQYPNEFKLFNYALYNKSTCDQLKSNESKTLQNICGRYGFPGDKCKNNAQSILQSACIIQEQMKVHKAKLSSYEMALIKEKGIFPHAQQYFLQKSVFCEKCRQKEQEYSRKYCHFRWDIAECIYLDQEEAYQCEQNLRYKREYCPKQVEEACLAACYSKNKNKIAYQKYARRTPTNFEMVLSDDDCNDFCTEEIVKKFICHKENKFCFDIVFPLCIRGCTVYAKYHRSGQLSVFKANMIKLKLYLDRKQNYQNFRNYQDQRNYDEIQNLCNSYNRDRIQDSIYLKEEDMHRELKTDLTKRYDNFIDYMKKQTKKVIDFYNSNTDGVYKVKDPKSPLNVFQLDLDK